MTPELERQLKIGKWVVLYIQSLPLILLGLVVLVFPKFQARGFSEHLNLSVIMGCLAVLSFPIHLFIRRKYIDSLNNTQIETPSIARLLSQYRTGTFLLASIGESCGIIAIVLYLVSGRVEVAAALGFAWVAHFVLLMKAMNEGERSLRAKVP